VAPVVALVLMEGIRDQDRPAEVFEEENTSITMPRRFGLSEVVLQQIRRLEIDVKRKRRLTEAELGALLRLVIRRPDATEILFGVGRDLAMRASPPTRLQRLVPARLGFWLARRRARKALRALFGRRVGSFCPEPFALEGQGLLFIRADPGGEVCELATGFLQQVIRNVTGGEERVFHDQCEARKDGRCRWSVTQREKLKAAKPAASRAAIERIVEVEPGAAPARTRLPDRAASAAS
jgi:hypothetical protein